MEFLMIIFINIIIASFYTLVSIIISKLFKVITVTRISIATSVAIVLSLILPLAYAGLLLVYVIMPVIIAVAVDRKHSATQVLLLICYFCIINFLIILPNLGAASDKARRISCCSNLKQLGICLMIYADDNKGHFPDKDGDAGLEMLRQQDYLTDYDVYLCPSTSDLAPKSGSVKSSYIYHGGLTTAAPEKTILMEDKPGNHKGYHNYLYCGMWVKGIKDPNYHDPSKDIVIKRLFRLLGWLR